MIGSISSSKQKLLLYPKIAYLRAIKSQAEQKVMNQAGTISGRAHAKVGMKPQSRTKLTADRPCVLRNQDCQKLLWQLTLNIYVHYRDLSALLMFPL